MRPCPRDFLRICEAAAVSPALRSRLTPAGTMLARKRSRRDLIRGNRRLQRNWKLRRTNAQQSDQAEKPAIVSLPRS